MTERRTIESALPPRLDAKPALVDGRRTVTFGEYHRYVAGAVDWLRAHGITEKQRVGILAENSIEYIITLMALINSGAVACPLNVIYPTEKLTGMLDQIDCRSVVHSTSFKIDSPNVNSIPIIDLSELKTASAAIGGPKLELDATIVFTSGSSSQPKAVLHTYGNHYYSALGSNENIALGSDDRWLLSLPLYHVGGLGVIFRCLLAGAAVVVPGMDESISEAVKRYQITHMSLVPAQLQKLLKEPITAESKERLKCVLVGGSHVPASLLNNAVGQRMRIRTTYGSTEMASQVTTTSSDDSPDRLATSGRLLKHREISISDDSELLVRGKTLFKGYVTLSGLQPSHDDDGWFHTGDVGSLDADGYLTVTGRMDNMFISGGENIYPEEIEAAMLSIEAVEEVVVVPVDDIKFGQRPVAFVRFVSGKAPAPDDIRQALGARLPKYMIPDKILQWPGEAASEGIKLDRKYFEKRASQHPA